MGDLEDGREVRFSGTGFVAGGAGLWVAPGAEGDQPEEWVSVDDCEHVVPVDRTPLGELPTDAFSDEAAAAASTALYERGYAVDWRDLYAALEAFSAVQRRELARSVRRESEATARGRQELTYEGGLRLAARIVEGKARP